MSAKLGLHLQFIDVWHVYFNEDSMQAQCAGEHRHIC